MVKQSHHKGLDFTNVFVKEEYTEEGYLDLLAT
jgi:hypothetical protein